MNAAAADLWQRLRAAGSHLTEYEVERALIDAHGAAERRFELTAGEPFVRELLDLRARLSAGSSLAAMEATARYGLINALVAEIEQRAAAAGHAQRPARPDHQSPGDRLRCCSCWSWPRSSRPCFPGPRR